MNVRWRHACGLALVCAFAALPPARAEGGIAMRQLAGEHLPALVSAFDAALLEARTPGGETGVFVRVSNADASGGLAALRFANGDQLLRIDSAPVTTAAAARALVAAKKPGEDVTFALKSGGAPRVIAIEILPTAESAPQPAESAPAAPRPVAPVASPPRPAVASPGVVVVSAADLERELAQYDPVELVLAAELEMVQDGAGNTIGLASSQFGNISLSRMVGLRNGDVVMGVNGMQVTSPEAVFAIAEKLEGETNFAAQILRGGKPMTLRVKVQ